LAGFGDVGFCGGKKTGEPEEKPLEQGENQQEIHHPYTARRNRTRATSVGGERSHHAPLNNQLTQLKRKCKT